MSNHHLQPYISKPFYWQHYREILFLNCMQIYFLECGCFLFFQVRCHIRCSFELRKLYARRRYQSPCACCDSAQENPLRTIRLVLNLLWKTESWSSTIIENSLSDHGNNVACTCFIEKKTAFSSMWWVPIY